MTLPVSRQPPLPTFAESGPPDRRNTAGEKALFDRLAAIDARLAEITVRRSCANPRSRKQNSHRGVMPIAVRGGIANVAQLKQAAPLPETADELCDVAHMLGAAESDVLLGTRSVEPEIVRMSERGRVQRMGR